MIPARNQGDYTMKRNKIALTATSGLVGLPVLAGSLAYASTGSDAEDAE
tara:strand:+ start:2537 stop:2683 length:147 start_codon:yes stop_codon:yes gene_type:complete